MGEIGGFIRVTTDIQKPRVSRGEEGGKGEELTAGDQGRT